MERRASARKTAGFSLVELIVVIAVVLLMLSLLLPVLSRTRESADSRVCENNQQSLFEGLIMVITIDPKIPNTYTTDPSRLQWSGAIDAVLQTNPQATREGITLVCPTVEKRFPDIYYLNIYNGFAINPHWKPGLGPGSNEGLSFDIVNHSKYPWFTDVKPFLSPAIARDFFGVFSVFDYDIGFHHDAETTSVTYGDGSARAENRKTVLGGPTGPGGLPLWMTGWE